MARRLNKKRLETLAVWLENGAKHETIKFDMTYGISFVIEDFDPTKPTECATSCCLAGAAVQFFDPKKAAALETTKYNNTVRDHGYLDEIEVKFYGDGGVMDRAATLLGLDDDRASRLFLPNDYFTLDPDDYSNPKLAAKVVRHLIETGKVDWEIEAETA